MDRYAKLDRLPANVLSTAILHNIHDGIIVISSESVIIFANQALVHIFGYENVDFLMGKPVEILMNKMQGAMHQKYVDRHIQDENVDVVNKMRRIKARHADGHLFPVDIHVVQTKYEGDIYYVGFVRDMSELEEKEQELHRSLYYDKLTGLPNLISLERFLDGYFQPDEHQPLLMAFLGIDAMRSINETFGFEVGNSVLRIVAERIRMALDTPIFVGRIGGDQFALVFEIPTGMSVNTLVDRANADLQNAFATPVEVDNTRISVKITRSYIPLPEIAWSIESALKHAEITFGEAKEHHRGSYLIATEDKIRRRTDNASMPHRLRDGITLNEFSIVVQPKINLQSSRYHSGECLVRWKEGGTKMVPPDRFIPVAEHADLIENIGRFVFLEACRTVRDLKAGNPSAENHKIAVNLSPKQLERSGFVRFAVDNLTALGLNPSNIEFEITETAIISSSETVTQALVALREVGFTIALDDFGTGYSSLGVIANLPIDRMKLDRSFLKGMHEDRRKFSLVKNTISLARDIGLNITVEGVETEEISKTIHLLGADEAQGYFYSRPLEPDAYKAFLQSAPTSVAPKF